VWTCTTRGPLPREVAAAYLAPYDTWQSRIATLRFVQDIPLSPSDKAYGVVEATAEGLHLLADLPMQIHWGMQDFVFDAAFLAEWERRFPEAEVHRYDDAGHYILEDAASEIVPRVVDFLGRT